MDAHSMHAHHPSTRRPHMHARSAPSFLSDNARLSAPTQPPSGLSNKRASFCTSTVQSPPPASVALQHCSTPTKPNARCRTLSRKAKHHRVYNHRSLVEAPVFRQGGHLLLGRVPIASSLEYMAPSPPPARARSRSSQSRSLHSSSPPLSSDPICVPPRHVTFSARCIAHASC